MLSKHWSESSQLIHNPICYYAVFPFPEILYSTQCVALNIKWKTLESVNVVIIIIIVILIIINNINIIIDVIKLYQRKLNVANIWNQFAVSNDDWLVKQPLVQTFNPFDPKSVCPSHWISYSSVVQPFVH